MIPYIVKSLLCAAVLFLIYFLLLEREKMHRFNRFYLLFSIIFSLTVSFITIKAPSPVVTVNEIIAPSGLTNIATALGGFNKFRQSDQSTTLTASTTPDIKNTQVPAPVKNNIPWLTLIVGLYIAGSAFLLLRFIHNLTILVLTAAECKKVSYNGATLVLTKDNALPHSFLNYIFIDEEKYEQGTIEKEILKHELTHVQQKHTIDILLVELVMVFAWINPLLFLFRKAIMLNHEFLADDAVINTYHDSRSYRMLLFNKVTQTNNLVLSSPFNYHITKKRLLMMTRNTSPKVAVLKQIALIPLIGAIGFLLSTRVIAQDKPKNEPRVAFVKYSPPNIIPDKGGNPDAPQSILDEYLLIESAYNIDTAIMRSHRISPKATMEEYKEYGRLTHLDTLKIKDHDRERLVKLFFKMSHKQQRHQFFQFSERPAVLSKLVPSTAQFESWKDSNKFGVWINGKRYKNAELNNHKNTDFGFYELRKMDKNTARVLKYQFEVGLTTKESFEKTQNEILADWKARPGDKYYLGFITGHPVDRNQVKNAKK